jgi:hypothetical protein
MRMFSGRILRPMDSNLVSLHPWYDVLEDKRMFAALPV